MHSFQDVTGLWHHTFRQSDLSEFRMCPEKLRTKPKDSPGTDATLIGTGTHTAVELWLESEGSATLEDCQGVANAVLEAEWDSIRMIQMDSMEEARYNMLNSIDCFWERRAHFPFGGEIEKPFALMHVYRDQYRTISFTGTPDYYHAGMNMIFDWKTNAAKYHKSYWKTERYAVQPTMYCMAMQLIGRPIPEFTFVRFPKEAGGEMEMATVQRDENDFATLMHQSLNLATLIESDIPTWPMLPIDWWCSPKWCDTFRAGKCMGLYQSERSWAAPYMDVTEDQYNALQVQGESNE